ncbi:MAG: DUF302 domain-containing protein [candidate division KSB1 bacterium]|nr:DUF302 domain-containing protein [candidate division KSB1 bacterium]MDZ7345286.1 DUF302 domain-containing protein [candidate division KSB1 bacterium]
MKYYFSKTLQTSFDQALHQVTEALKKEGFGVISTINVQQAMKDKLGVDFRPYIILGACNPPYAYKALSLEDKIGVFLPCNVIIQQRDDATVEVAAVDPFASMQAVENSALAEIAGKVRHKLKNVIESLR